MGISCLVSESMVYHDLVAVSEELELDAFHDSVACRIDRVARLHGKIHTGMTGRTAIDRVFSVTETAGEPVP